MAILFQSPKSGQICLNNSIVDNAKLSKSAFQSPWSGQICLNSFIKLYPNRERLLVSIPLIGSNLFKSRWDNSWFGWILCVSIPLVGSNLFKLGLFINKKASKFMFQSPWSGQICLNSLKDYFCKGKISKII